MEAALRTHGSSPQRNWMGTSRRYGGSCRVGIEEIVVWGGTLAIAGLMAVFTIRTSATRRKSGHETIIVHEESTIIFSGEADEGDGECKKVLSMALAGDCCKVPSAPTAAATHDQCIHSAGPEMGVAHVDSCDSISNQSSIPVHEGEMLARKMGREQESQMQPQGILLLSDDSKEERIASRDDHCVAEESLLPRRGEISRGGSMVNSAEQKASDDDNEEEDSTAEEYSTEEGDDSLEETGDSSSESTFEAVWPVGSINEGSTQSRELSNTDINEENPIGENYSTCSDMKILRKEPVLGEALFESYQTAHLLKSGNWIFFAGIMLLMLLPLLLSAVQEDIMNTYATDTDAFPIP